MTTRIPLWLTALGALVFGSGCIDLDSKPEIKDLRILGLRLDPPEIMYSPILAMPAAQRPPVELPPTVLEASLLAVDPRSSEPLPFTYHVCPVDDFEMCINYQLPDVFENERDPDALRISLARLVNRRAALLAPGDNTGGIGGPLGRLNFDLRATEYILPHLPDGTAIAVFQQFARLIVRAENQGVAETAYRRIPLNLDLRIFAQLPDAARQFSEYLGITICTAEQSQAHDPSCLQIREPNRNPTIEEFRFTRGIDYPKYDDKGDDTREVGEVVGGPIPVAPGAEITLWPVMARGDVEPYQVFEVDIEQKKIKLTNYVEEMAVSWYATRDLPIPPLTALSIEQHLGATYLYPSLNPPERVRIYAVVRDQRGGVAWGSVELVRE
ncbi:MAG: hypothetical protein JXR83_18860 [Deltaproteobacteria bacterium]|nr:hypothetical protein [Deltaproteobacteria bacterium]